MQSILAVGFRHRVELLCQQRLTYFDGGPGWATCTSIAIGKYVSHSPTQKSLSHDLVSMCVASFLIRLRIRSGSRTVLFSSALGINFFCLALLQLLPTKTRMNFRKHCSSPLQDKMGRLMTIILKSCFNVCFGVGTMLSPSGLIVKLQMIWRPHR